MRNCGCPSPPLTRSQTLFTPTILIRAKFDPLFSCTHTHTFFYTCEKLTVNAYAFMHTHIITLMCKNDWTGLNFDVFIYKQTCLLAHSLGPLHAHTSSSSHVIITDATATFFLSSFAVQQQLFFGLKISSAWLRAIVFSMHSTI